MVKKIVVIVTLLLVSSLLTLATLNESKTTSDDGSVTSQSYLMQFSFIQNTSPSVRLCSGVNLSNYRKSGWPLRYETKNVDEPGCGDAIYPLVFALDIIFFLAILTITSWGVVFIRKRGQKH